MKQPKKWGHIPTPWLFEEVEMKIKGVNIFNDIRIIADVSDTLLGASNIITQINNAERIVDCVNAMEGIEDPKKFRENWEAVKHLELDKYHNLKEVIQNMIDRLDEHGEILLRKDSIIVNCLREAIK